MYIEYTKYLPKPYFLRKYLIVNLLVDSGIPKNGIYPQFA